MNKIDNAIRCFSNGFNCSQSVFSAFANELGLDKKTALKIGSPFGAGMARMAETCGAVTGAFMVIGLKYGKFKIDDNEAKEKTYKLVQEFVIKFKERNGSIVCKELLGCDIGTTEGMKIAKEKGLFNTDCPKFVRDAVEILEEIL
ncbi:TPA: C_GCAxxG_C_C family protein [bacterium]|jgi:C_GCAxxG_C_C family probable redox protein|nr:C_GCAxxG_C_C family protein [bacterium]